MTMCDMTGSGKSVAGEDGRKDGELAGDGADPDTGVGDNRGKTAPWSWDVVLPFQPHVLRFKPRSLIWVVVTLLHQDTDNVFGRP